MISTLESITVSELPDLLRSLQLPPDTRLKIIFEDDEVNVKAMRRKRALEAMQRLKGSGNGNLVTTLLTERAKDALK